MRSLSLAVLALSLCACSIFNKPDRSRLDGHFVDGGTDVGVDASDAGMDAGHDAWVCAGGNHEMCGDGRDNDCDGLVDCADPDCIAAQAPECCDTGTTTAVTEHFNRDGTGWTTAGDWVAAASVANAVTPAGKLSELGPGPDIGMVNRACLQVDLGTQLRFDLSASSCGGTDCDGHIDVVVGPSTSFMGALTSDLAMRARNVDGHLYVDVMQGPTVRASSADLGTSTQVTVDLSPGLVGTMPAIVGTVSVTRGSELDQLVDQIYVTDRDVFGTSTCHGLRLGVQGFGRQIALDEVRISQLNCSNPARFDTVHDDADELDAVTMSVSDVATHSIGWGHGGIGDPALIEGVLAGHGGAHSFTLLFDGSPVDRASDVIGHLPLAIGGADTTAQMDGQLVLVDDCSRWTPRGITTDCMPQSAATGHAVIEAAGLVMRDPTLYPVGHDQEAINPFRIAWVGETAAGSPLSLFVGTLEVDPVTRIASATASMIHGETCPSIRNPLLLPLLGTTDHDFLLLYICDTFPPVVHAARMQGTTVTRIDGLVLGPDELGPLAAQGVIDVAGVVYDYQIDTGPVVRTPTYRLWLVTRPTTTDTAVLYVEGRPPDRAAAGTIPTFTRFAGNPVLTEHSPVFGMCALGCQIHGITATRISDDLPRVRLLVERWVDTGSGLTYGLVPLEQTWPSDEIH